MDNHHHNYYRFNRNEINMEQRILKWSTLSWFLKQS
jgi:hypothetical protein